MTIHFIENVFQYIFNMARNIRIIFVQLDDVTMWGGEGVH